MNFLDGYITKALPHVHTAGRIACAYGEAIVHRLERIQEVIQSEEFIEYHPRQTFTLSAGVSQDMLQIPTTEMWELQFVSCSGGGAVITIAEAADAAPRYMKLFTNADAQPAIGLIFGGGNAPTITATLNASPVLVSVQMRRRKVKPAVATNAAGLIEAGDVFNGHPNGENPTTVRHANGTGHAPNIRGAMVGDGLVDVYGGR